MEKASQGVRGSRTSGRRTLKPKIELITREKCKSCDDTNVSQSVWSFFRFAKSRKVSRYLATISRWTEIFRRWFTRCERPLSNVSEFSTNGATVDGSQRPGRNDDLSRHLERSCALRIRHKRIQSELVQIIRLNFAKFVSLSIHLFPLIYFDRFNFTICDFFFSKKFREKL